MHWFLWLEKEMYKNNESGRTMMEMLMYLSIIIILMLGSIKLTQSVLDKFKLSRVGEQINELSKGITSRFMAKSRYDDINDDNVMKNMIEEKVIPQDMVQSNNLFTHSYGGKAIINPLGSSFLVTFEDLPLRPCVELGLMNWTINDRTNLVNIKINNKEYVWDEKPSAGKGKLPVTTSAIAGDCKDDRTNKIIWEFE